MEFRVDAQEFKNKIMNKERIILAAGDEVYEIIPYIKDDITE